MAWSEWVTSLLWLGGLWFVIYAWTMLHAQQREIERLRKYIEGVDRKLAHYITTPRY